jgi:amidase
LGFELAFVPLTGRECVEKIELTNMTLTNLRPSSRLTARRTFLKTLAGVPAAATFGSGVFLRDLKASTPLPDDLCYWPATKLAKAIRDRTFSSQQLVERYLARIGQINRKINGVVQLATDRALAEAQAADAALAQGRNLGPLHGVPVTIKDSFDTEGIISTAGTKGRANFLPSQDATVVARLRAAGAIILGKTNTPEFTLAGNTDNLVYGRTNNPFDLTRIPGGSSGGPASIVAAGGAAFDIGTDTVASIRWPAQCCGVAGMKPTSKRISLAGHIIRGGTPLGDQTQPGPIARYVADLILTLPILVGADPRDPSVEVRPLGDPASVDLKDLRIAFYTNNAIATPSAEIIAVVRSAAAKLLDLGARVEEEAPKELAQTPSITDTVFQLTGRDYFRGLLTAAGTSTAQAGGVLQYLASQTAILNASQTEAAQARIATFKTALGNFMQAYDIIICPVNWQVAPIHSGDDPDVTYTETYSDLGWPAAVVRCGTSTTGLPIGVQIVGRPWDEHIVLAVAQFLETAMGGWKPVPQPVFNAQQTTGAMNLTWKGFGTVEQAGNLNGPWAELPSATSPYRPKTAAGNAFYRIRQ